MKKIKAIEIAATGKASVIPMSPQLVARVVKSRDTLKTVVNRLSYTQPLETEDGETKEEETIYHSGDLYMEEVQLIDTEVLTLLNELYDCIFDD